MVSVKSIRRIGAAALILPVADHVIAPAMTMIFAPEVMSTMFGSSGAIPTVVFFISLGLFQIFCIALILKSNNPSLLGLGVLGNIVSIVIYLVSASGVTLPFGVPPQPFIAFALLIKALEATFVLAVLCLFKTRSLARL